MGWKQPHHMKGEKTMNKNTPIITHTEILCYAIYHLEAEIEDMRKKCEGVPWAEEFIQNTINRNGPKLEALKAMYRIETGSEIV